MLDPEIEEKNIEYKRKLSLDIINTHRINTLITQMKWRINEGDGIAFYYLGVNDNGSIYEFIENEEFETIETFKSMCFRYYRPWTRYFFKGNETVGILGSDQYRFG